MNQQTIVHFFYGKWNANHHLGKGSFVHKVVRSAIKKVEFVGDRMSHIKLTGRWCDIVLNVHTPTEDASDDTKDSFHKELRRR
jgi:hypothetical protein